MFAELVRSGGEPHRGIVAIATDFRLERRRERGVVARSGMNLFVGGRWHLRDDVVASAANLERLTDLRD